MSSIYLGLEAPRLSVDQLSSGTRLILSVLSQTLGEYIRLPVLPYCSRGSRS